VNVADVDTGLVLKVLEPVWLKMPETASRLRGRIEAVLGWATVHGYRTGDNPARLRGHLGEVLPKKSKIRPVQHQPALPYQETAAFMAELRSKAGIGARALEFTILTAARTGEVIGATWAEIDIETKVWTVPADRMKMGKAHSVPLSDRAVEILKALPREHGNDHVFIGGRKGAGLSNMAMLKLMKGMRPGLTVHGFRSTFRDWAGECTNFPREIAEAALAHTLSSDTEAAYRRGTALEKRRKMMTAWAGYCSRPVAVGGDVIPINKAASA
jgi:integrase